MKQHITQTQLNELSDKGKEKLREWWKENRHEGDAYSMLNLDLPLLHIGQMIEFLGDDWYVHSDLGREPLFSGGYDGEVIQRFDGEFCDALWSCVREILERE